MKKEMLIKRIKKLQWGDVLWGCDEEGKIININEYNQDLDKFNVYGEDLKCHWVRFEDLPQQLF